jgi:hypothetical protein
MTVQVPVLFVPTLLGASPGIIATVPSTPANVTYANGRVRLTNVDGSAHAVTLYAVPPGGVAGVGNCQLAGESVGPNAHVDVDVPKLPAGGTIQAFADAASVVVISELGGVLIS